MPAPGASAPRILLAALCLAPMLAACELVVDFDRSKLLDAGGADMGMPTDMGARDMPTTDMPVLDMELVDMELVDMELVDMELVDMNVPDMPEADLGEDLGTPELDLGTDLGPPDLGPSDLGPPDLGPPMCPASCDDTNPCTTDSCDVGTGLCAHVSNTAACSDGNPCTLGDSCSASACVPGTPRNCADTNVCTNDSCDSGSGACVHAPNTAVCNDGDPCTVSDVCAASVCGGAAVDCSGMDGQCVVGICNAGGSCVTANRPDATTCNDANECTATDVCTAGTCAGAAVVDGTICTSGGVMCVAGVCTP